MKSYFVTLLSLFVSFFIVACSQKEEEVAVSSVTISQPTAEMIVGETVRLSATITPSNATDKDVIWASSKQSVATVDKSGVVTAIAEGASNITASAGGKVGTCVVTVSKKVIVVSSIELNKTELALVEEEEFTLVATVKPDDATDKTVSWSSSDPSVATVAEGKVKALKEGTATITAKAGDKSSACLVTIAKKVIAVESISLNKETLSLTKGQSETLIATVKPDDATDKTVTWTTSNSNTVSVDNGKVTAVGGGRATITAKAGEVEATCEVTVTVPVSSVTLDKNTLSLVEGEESTLNATVKPDDATDKTVIWTSSNSTIATVENGKVKALKEGSVTITAKTGEKSATCSVTVSKKVVPVSSVSLSQTSLALVEGDETTLTATVKPDDATDKTVSWTSNKTDVVSVDQNGKVKALKEGLAIITAKAGDITASCSVEVSKKVIAVTSITLDKTTLSLTKGEESQLVATVKPDDATDKTVTWTTSDASIVTVNSGKVKAVKSGSASIIAKAGEKSAICEVTVTTPVESITLDSNSATLEEGQSIALTATINPTDADEKTITWSTSNEKVATVNQDGKVTAVSKGTAIIKAEAQDGSGRYATCSVAVIRLVSSIVLDKTSIVLYNGQPTLITATVSPADASNTGITWTSSDSSIATVSSYGIVLGKSAGNVTITAKAKDSSGKEASCIVEVRQYVTRITLDKSGLSLVPGESYSLVATVSPSDAYDKTLTWTSSNTTVATVDASGVVRAVADGTTTITAEANDDSGKQATCSVSVELPYTAVAGEAVDLGLSVKWSTWNLGATKPEEYGDYFALGESEPYYLSGHSQDSPCRSWRNGKTGYNRDSYQYDDKGDTARAVLGGDWRTPTDEEWTELRNNCEWTWTNNYNATGVAGYNVGSRSTGKGIFLPAAGRRDDYFLNHAGNFGFYWSSTGTAWWAWMVEFIPDHIYRKSDERCLGRTIRPVTK